MDLRKLKTLIDLVQNSGISELEISEGEEKIRIAKHAAPRPRTTTVMMARRPTAAAPAARRGAAAAAEAAPAEPEGHVVKSPMVGTFYRSGSPGAAGLRRGRPGRQGRATRSASSKR